MDLFASVFAESIRPSLRASISAASRIIVVSVPIGLSPHLEAAHHLIQMLRSFVPVAPTCWVRAAD